MSAPTVSPPELEQAKPESQSGFGAAAREYVLKLRGGDVGALPAVLGLIVLVVVFSVLRPSTFTGAFNFANLIHQSAGVIVIAMGLVFVLLLGEIDLSAGFTAGTSAAILGIVLTRHGMPWPVAVLAALVTGAVIGASIGLLVSRLGIPSFVVTLAAFLGLQGVMLELIGEGGTISIGDKVLLGLNNSNMPVWLGWVLYVLGVCLYASVTLLREFKRRSTGLVTKGVPVVIFKIIVMAVLLGLATYYLSIERSPNPTSVSIKGVPVVVVLLTVLLIGLTFLLSRTPFGRHVYAVGGNKEAARRSGISVPSIQLACFMICSTMAAVAGILIASRDNSISPTTGGADTLLYAVGAAVIGGTSLFGGKGRPLDAILGGLVIAIIVNGMGLLNETSAVVYMVTAIVLLVAASVDAISRRRATASGRA